MKVKGMCGTVRKFARRTALLAYLLLFLVTASPAQPPYRFFSWTTENGLPQNSIQALLQTRNGYLWMSTLEGLVRFDGPRFRVFPRRHYQRLLVLVQIGRHAKRLVLRRWR